MSLSIIQLCLHTRTHAHANHVLAKHWFDLMTTELGIQAPLKKGSLCTSVSRGVHFYCSSYQVALQCNERYCMQNLRIYT